MRRLILLAALVQIAIGINRTTADDAIPSVSYGQFPFPVTRAYVYPSEGRPAGVAELHSWAPNDFPPCLTIALETGREAEGGGRFLILARNYLRVYRTREVKTAPYQTIQENLANLERLLKRRVAQPPNRGKSGKTFKDSQTLPDYPPRNAGHLIESKMSYADPPWGRGIFYISQFVQGVGEAPNNQQLVYLFQGTTKDKNFFVSADFQISHPAVPARPEDIPNETKEVEALCGKIEKFLDKAPDESFTPSLRTIRDWIATLNIEE